MNRHREGWIAGRVFYTAVAAYYWAVTIYMDNLYVSIAELPKGEWYLEKVGYLSYGGRYKYLTHWNLMIQRFYFSMACIAYLTKWSALRSLSKFIFNSIIIPMSVVVTLMFWIIYAIDRGIIFPPFYDEIYPWWVNHSLHSFCALLTAMEVLAFPCPVPRHLKWERLSIFIVIISYSAWMPWASYQNGKWPYEFMRLLTNIQLVLFCFTSSVLCVVLHYLGVVVRKLKWGRYSIRVEYEATNKLD